MKRLAFLLVYGFATLSPVRAFVANYDTSNHLLRWNIAAPDGSVSTNVINPVTKAVRFQLAADAYSAANRDAELRVLRSAFAQWQAVPGATLKFEEGALAPAGMDINTFDNTNVVFWAKTQTADGRVFVNGGHDEITGALAVTFWDSFQDDHAIAEADIVFNSFIKVSGQSYSWSAEYLPSERAFSIEAILLHEIGHLIGLEHSPVGAATMMARAESGSPRMAGLSSDELGGVRFLYPNAAYMASLAKVSGRVTLSGGNVLGAAVLAEDAAGNLVQGTVSRASGAYELSGLSPGAYQVRVTPLDPGFSAPLLWGGDISAAYASAQTSFLPTTPQSLTLAAGQQATMNFTVTGGDPAIRINRIRAQSVDPNVIFMQNAPAILIAGQSNVWVGVGGYTVPTGGATVTVTGDGVTVNQMEYRADIYGGSGFNLISINLSVASNAPPGMRSFVLKHGGDAAYANGFLDVQPPPPDLNHDDIDDRWQIQYFGDIQKPAAQANADPDGDGLNNWGEYIAETNPTNGASCLRIDAISYPLGKAQLVWRSVAGKSYQVYGCDNLLTHSWAPIAIPVTANGSSTTWTDPFWDLKLRFYRVLVLP